MIIVTQSQLRNKDTEAIILLRNEIKADEHPGLICNSSVPDGKTQRRERRAKAIRRRKGRL